MPAGGGVVWAIGKSDKPLFLPRHCNIISLFQPQQEIARVPGFASHL
jgi:hypothetical protein